MRVPISWLKEYVSINIPTQELADRLTAIGVAIESVEHRNKAGLSGVVAAHIRTIEKHPNADRLRVGQLEVGGETLQIVTGAQNVQAGDTIPLARIGARVFDKEGKPQRIDKGKLRGIESFGMMCSANELGIDGKNLPEAQREGVMILPPDTPPGADVLKLFGIEEEVLIVEPFANRPDYLSIYGIAREVAVLLGEPLKPLVLDFAESSEDASALCKVENEAPELCQRYIARVILDASAGPSPLWMQGRLAAAGMRSINRIVDVTNYVLVEVGQPLHSFDYDKLEGHLVAVRKGRTGESMKSIDGETRALNDSMLVIADARVPVAIAGVMGGLDSEVSDATSRVLLESAHFHAATVRRTSQALGLRSESSRRFEKNLPYENADLGSRRACALLASFGARIARGYVEAGTPAPTPVSLDLKPATVARVLGVSIPSDRIESILKALHMTVSAGHDGFTVKVPGFRPDLRREIDLVEEVARHYGYDNVPTTLPGGRAQGGSVSMEAGEEWLRDQMARQGFFEAITAGLYGADAREKTGFGERTEMKVYNPLSEDQAHLRSTLLVHLLEVLVHNARARQTSVRMFELSKIYTPGVASNNGGGVQEQRRLGMVLWGDGTDLFTGRGAVEALGSGYSFAATEAPGFHRGKTARVMLHSQDVGVLGVLHPQKAAALELEGDVVLAELDYEAILADRKVVKYRPIARFPESERDMAFIVREDVVFGQLEGVVREVAAELLQSVRCMDVYRGDQIPSGHKSMMIRLVYQAADRTLSDKELEGLTNRIEASLADRFEAKLRKG
ncbi:MAG: phenylalanine--tRNA ligase subunit beta [Candidatus Xenobia bacterium]